MNIKPVTSFGFPKRLMRHPFCFSGWSKDNTVTIKFHTRITRVDVTQETGCTLRYVTLGPRCTRHNCYAWHTFWWHIILRSNCHVRTPVTDKRTDIRPVNSHTAAVVEIYYPSTTTASQFIQRPHVNHDKLVYRLTHNRHGWPHTPRGVYTLYENCSRKTDNCTQIWQSEDWLASLSKIFQCVPHVSVGPAYNDQ